MRAICNPFHNDEQPQHLRWLITTCVAAIAGSVVIATVLSGVFCYGSGISQLGRQFAAKVSTIG
jgi:hypothetical protein